MRKAKSPTSTPSSAPDLMSMLEGLKGIKQESKENVPKPGESPMPVLQPPFYNKNAYADVISKHDRIVSKILKNRKD